MDSIPVPELLVVVAISLVIAGLRALWRTVQGQSIRQSASGGPIGQEETDKKRTQMIASCVLFAIMSIPHILRVIPPNGFYGFRVRATQNPAVWYPANAFMGWALLIAAVTSTTLLLLLPTGVKRWQLWAAFLLPIVAAMVASFAYLARLG